jgi:hypothetical protein
VSNLGLSPAAWAAPGRFFLPAGDVTIPGACPFPVLIHPIVDNEYGTLTTAPDGSTVLMVTGNAVATYSNTITGKSITLNASGPGLEAFHPNGAITFDTEGPGVYITLPYAQQEFGTFGFDYFKGHVQATVNAAGIITAFSWSGSSMDLCAVLS